MKWKPVVFDYDLVMEPEFDEEVRTWEPLNTKEGHSMLKRLGGGGRQVEGGWSWCGGQDHFFLMWQDAIVKMVGLKLTCF